jgi:hypothetical protein
MLKLVPEAGVIVKASVLGAAEAGVEINSDANRATTAPRATPLF